MSWNMDFGLASLFVLSVLLAYNIIRRDLPLQRNKAFNALLIAVAVADILDIISSYFELNRSRFPGGMIYLSVVLYYAAVIFIPFIFTRVVTTLTDRMKAHNQRMGRISLVMILILELAVLTTPFTGLAYSYDPTRGFIEKPAFYVINILSALMMFLSCAYIYFHRNGTSLMHRRSIYMFTAIAYATALLQFFVFPDIPIICSGFALSALITYIAVQNPDFYRDQRTGIFSRNGFNALQLEHYKEKEKTSVLCIGFSNYHILNNSYGDEIVQPFLQKISAFLSKEVCGKDVIPFYVHNGRFVLLKSGFYDFSKEKTAIDSRFLSPWISEDLSFQFSPVYAYISSEIKITRMQEINALIDRALDDAIKNGPFSFIAVDEELTYENRHELKIRMALDRAIDNDTLEVWFQPIYSPASDRINSAEALVRIEDEELGVIYPDEFIKTAESNGSILKLGRQVYKKICEFISTHDIKKYGLDYIEVNLSPIQCLNEHLAEEFIGIRKSYGVDPGMINLEITETAASDSSVVIENMLRLSRDGFTFSLDDYGTGYSNLMNMLSLPLSIIKVDKSIVWSYFDQSFTMSVAAGGENYATGNSSLEKDNNILEDLIPMFQARGLKVLCEGVETKEMVRVLGEMGCDYMQGFFFSKPIPQDDFIEYVKAKNRNRGI